MRRRQGGERRRHGRHNLLYAHDVLIHHLAQTKHVAEVLLRDVLDHLLRGEGEEVAPISIPRYSSCKQRRTCMGWLWLSS